MVVNNLSIKKQKFADQQKKALLKETDSSDAARLWIQLGSVIGGQLSFWLKIESSQNTLLSAV
jgi:hypothetical protein